MEVSDTEQRQRSGGRTRSTDVGRRDSHVLEVAERLWLEHGSLNVSLGAIAREARVATRTIYAQFGGKDGIARAMLYRLAGKNQAAIAAALTAGTLADGLIALADRLLWTRMHPLWRQLRLYLMTQQDAGLETLLHEEGMAPLLAATQHLFRRLPLPGQAAPARSAALLSDMFLGVVLALEYQPAPDYMAGTALKTKLHSLVKCRVLQFILFISEDGSDSPFEYAVPALELPDRRQP